jgi:hypothetical protein
MNGLAGAHEALLGHLKAERAELVRLAGIHRTLRCLRW